MLVVRVVVAWIVNVGRHVVQVVASVSVDAGGAGGGGLDHRCWRSRHPGNGLHHC